MKSPQQPRTVKVSFMWLVGLLVLVLGVAFVGGIVSTRLLQPNLTPLISDESGRIVSTVQQVTISPGKAAAAIVQDHGQSIIALTEQRGDAMVPVGLGIVLTNDGVVASLTDEEDVFAYDGTGQFEPLSRIGPDTLYGITYYRLTDAVIQPLELAQDRPAIGSALLAVGRSFDTLLPEVASLTLQTYVLSDSSGAPGYHTHLQLEDISTPSTGSALLDDEGRLTGLTIQGDAHAVAVTDIRESLNRLTQNMREENPFETYGFTVSYEYVFDEDTTSRRFAAKIASVTSRSPARDAGLRAGDVLVAVGNTNVSFDTSVARLLAASDSMNVTIQRNDTQQELVLQPPQASPSPSSDPS